MVKPTLTTAHYLLALSQRMNLFGTWYLQHGIKSSPRSIAMRHHIHDVNKDLRPKRQWHSGSRGADRYLEAEALKDTFPTFSKLAATVAAHPGISPETRVQIRHAVGDIQLLADVALLAHNRKRAEYSVYSPLNASFFQL